MKIFISRQKKKYGKKDIQRWSCSFKYIALEEKKRKIRPNSSKLQWQFIIYNLNSKSPPTL